jgi:hypothetical protein
VQSLFDPLLLGIELPLRGTQYPLGFRLNIATNSYHVLQAAEEAWSIYSRAFARQPVDLRFIVQPEGALADTQPAFRGQGDLFSVVYDRDNFGVYEINSMAGYCFVSEQTAANHLRLRMHFLEAMTYSMLAQRHAMPLHAAAVVHNGEGILLCGASGAGKSSLAFSCARAGWTFVSDDATWLPVDEPAIAVGRPHHARFREDAPGLFPELARYAAEQRPNGKITIEAPMAHFPLKTSVTCGVDHLVLLDRRPGPPCISSVAEDEVRDRLLSDSPNYGEQVRLMYERTICRLSGLRAWRMQYESLDEGIRLLAGITGK